MIRMVSSDIDGTLLLGKQESLSPRIFDLIGQCSEKGIVFVAASGRQYPNLKRLFLPVWKDIYFVAENGGAVFYQDKVLFTCPIPAEMAKELVGELSRQKGCDLVISGAHSCYMGMKDLDFSQFIVYGLKNTTTMVEDVVALDEEIVKIAVHVGDTQLLHQMKEDYTARWSDRIEVALAGNNWLDFTLSNKGAALRRLQMDFNIGREQTMAFGDNFNDCGMLHAAGHSFAMEHAHPELKRQATGVCSSVEDTLEAMLEKQ